MYYLKGKTKRVLTAATQLQESDYVSPIVLGNEEKIKSLAEEKSLNLTNIEIIDPSSSDLKPELVDEFVERRKVKRLKNKLKKC